jgi:hypothetical protein
MCRAAGFREVKVVYGLGADPGAPRSPYRRLRSAAGSVLRRITAGSRPLRFRAAVHAFK